MAFGREVDHDIVPRHQRIDQHVVSNITLDESVAIACVELINRCLHTRVREQIEVGDLCVRFAIESHTG